jgi:hypothetical protein
MRVAQRRKMAVYLAPERYMPRMKIRWDRV